MGVQVSYKTYLILSTQALIRARHNRLYINRKVKRNIIWLEEEPHYFVN